jgi:hypothetical protein
MWGIGVWRISNEDQDKSSSCIENSQDDSVRLLCPYIGVFWDHVGNIESYPVSPNKQYNHFGKLTNGLSLI